MPPNPERVYTRIAYDHPLFDQSAIAARSELWSIQGTGSVVCWRLFGAGFHEGRAIQAGLAAAEAMGGVRRPWSVANESGRIVLPPQAALVNGTSGLERVGPMSAAPRPPPFPPSMSGRCSTAASGRGRTGSNIACSCSTRRGRSRRRRPGEPAVLGQSLEPDRRPRDGPRPKGDGPLGDRVRRLARDRGLRWDGSSSVTLTAMPRVFGYVFKPAQPLCLPGSRRPARRADLRGAQHLRRHAPLCLRRRRPDGGTLRHRCEKDFFVSPFLPMELH